MSACDYDDYCDDSPEFSSVPEPNRPELGHSSVDESLFYAGPVCLVLLARAFDHNGVTVSVTVSQCSFVVLQSGIKQVIPRPAMLDVEYLPALFRDTAG